MYYGEAGYNREKGAITVFLSLIFLSIIIFAGVVIDISRIAAAERKVQSVLNSSARSVLAGYDKELAGGYGIFGVNTSAAGIKDDFFRYVTVNLEERHQGIRLLKIEVAPEDIDIKGADSLLGEESFKRQVQEYMKYRTAINASDALIEQLKNLKLDKKLDFARSERTARGKAKELRSSINVVNTRLLSARKKLAALSVEKLEELKQDLSEALTMSNSIINKNGGLIEDYEESTAESAVKAKEGDCIENRSQEFAGIRTEGEKLLAGLKKCIPEVNRTCSLVLPLHKELKSLEEKLPDLQEELADLKIELSELKEDENASSEKKDRIRMKLDKVRKKLEATEDRIDELRAQIDSHLNRLRDTLSEIPLDSFSLRDEAVAPSASKLKELKNSLSLLKKEIEASLPRSLKPEWLIAPQEFEAASLITGADFGEMDEDVRIDASIGEEEAEEKNNIVIQSLERLSKAVESIAVGAVEKVNTVEYVMNNFSFLTSRTERGHYFRKGEVEYIICGDDNGESSKMKNSEFYVAARVFLQVWALRFALDTIDDFARSAVIFPPQRLAFALAEGALDSCMDMLDMMNGEGVPICPKSLTGIKLKYSDHLRILLLMKPEQEILRKVRQLIQVNIKQVVDSKTGTCRSDFRLGDYDTVIEASVRARVNLYFLPVLRLDKLMPGSFENGKYVIHKETYIGY